MCKFFEKFGINYAFSFFSFLKNVLILQNQYRALLQYSFVKDASKDMPIASDWYCGKVRFNIIIIDFFGLIDEYVIL